MTSKDEKSLLDSARLGDDAALAELFEIHRGRLEKLVKIRIDQRLKKRIDIADILQETFIEVQKKIQDFFSQEKLPFFLWLRLEVGQKLTQAHRFHLGTKMRDIGQEVTLHSGRMPSVASLTLAEHLLGRLSTASQAAMKAEIKIKVQEALNNMDPNDREMLVLRHFEEMTNSESALALGISSTAACNRYIRALKRLKSVIEQMPGGIDGIWA